MVRTFWQQDKLLRHNFLWETSCKGRQQIWSSHSEEQKFLLWTRKGLLSHLCVVFVTLCCVHVSLNILAEFFFVVFLVCLVTLIYLEDIQFYFCSDIYRFSPLFLNFVCFCIFCFSDCHWVVLLSFALISAGDFVFSNFCHIRTGVKLKEIGLSSAMLLATQYW